jgi:DNA polymerase III gamma/tau subunit
VSFGLVTADSERLAEQASRLSEVALVRAIDALSSALSGIREGDDARMALELALLRSARPEIDPSRDALAQRLDRIERTIGRGELAAADPAGEIRVERDDSRPESDSPEAGSQPAGMRDPGPDSPEASAEPGGEVAGIEAGQTVATIQAAASGRPEPVGQTGAPAGATEIEPVVVAAVGEPRESVATADLDRVVSLWPAVVEQLRQSGSELLSTVIEAARPLAVDAERGIVEVGFPPSAAFNKRKAEMKANRELFIEALATIAGFTLRPSYVLLEHDDQQTASENGSAALSGEEEQALVDRLKSEFDAEEFDPDSAPSDDEDDDEDEAIKADREEPR